MNRIIKLILLWTVCLQATNVSAQQRISGTVSDDIDVVIGANVVERDKNNRIVSATVTDMNGNFALQIKDPKNKLSVTFMGYKPWAQVIGDQKRFNIKLQDNTKQMKDVVVTAKKKEMSGGLNIPTRELAGATQKFSMDEMEGMAFESVDQALQGQIAGLDIVANSGNLGSGMTMRLRGTSTLNGNTQPLIVVDDHIFDLPDDAQDINFEDMDTEEQFSTLLNVNPEDIESINVLKDGSTAKWGSRAASGVIEIKLRRGRRGPTNVTFSYKLNGTWQPSGYKMLDGDGYSMMLKEAYYNPQQKSTEIPELSYLPTRYPLIYNHFSGNTDWLKELRQFGLEHKYYVTLSGGGEKATFRISAGYDTSKGVVIGQTWNRFTTQTALDYWVSDRIKFSSHINMSFSNNNKNYDNNPNDRGYAAMPNMSVWEKDAQGNLTGNYFNMYPLATTISGTTANAGVNGDGKTSWELRDMFINGNPVAWALQAWNKEKQYNLTPQFDIEYKLLGKNDDEWQLNYLGDVQLNIYNTSSDRFVPAGLLNIDWLYGGENGLSIGSNKRNEVSNNEYKSLEFTTRQRLSLYPKFKNDDFSASVMAQFDLTTGSSSSQNTGLWNVPNGITDPTVTALLNAASAGNNEWRDLSMMEQAHLSYKSKYNLDGFFRTEGSTGFGKGHKFGNFGYIGLRWNIIDEPWMKWSRSIVSMLAFRPSWGLNANRAKNGGTNQFNKYTESGYYNGHTVIKPENLSLNQLRWEKKSNLNIGANLGLLDDLLNFDFNYYRNVTTDLVMTNQRIASANGFSYLSHINGGKMTNEGWELNFSSGWFAKVGKFSMKVRANIAQNFNTVNEMDPLILAEINPAETLQPANFDFEKNRRVQVNNALGSIYGLKYKGVYRYDYEHNGYTSTSFKAYGYAEVDANGNTFTNVQDATLYGTGYSINADGTKEPINTAAAAARRGDANVTCPIAHDAAGNMIFDQLGDPMPMYYCYNESYRYQFQGGDAIYEDINNDGQIDRYDMVYLGNCNPKWNGGFGFTLKFDRLQLNTGFTFRTGNQIINMARMNAESMLDNRNQSYATTWRWRKNGDETVVPRALTQRNGFPSYNSLPSDRYVENGDYLRMQYIQLSYDIDPKKLKKWGIRNLKFFFSMNNLFVWSKYTGVDPEIAQGSWNISQDNSKTPPRRSFTASVNLGF